MNYLVKLSILVFVQVEKKQPVMKNGLFKVLCSPSFIIYCLIRVGAIVSAIRELTKL